MFCTKCGAKIEDDTAFCTSCGAPVEAAAQNDEQPKCASCGAELEEGSAFCTACGTPVGPSAPVPAADPTPALVAPSASIPTATPAPVAAPAPAATPAPVAAPAFSASVPVARPATSEGFSDPLTHASANDQQKRKSRAIPFVVAGVVAVLVIAGIALFVADPFAWRGDVGAGAQSQTTEAAEDANASSDSPSDFSSSSASGSSSEEGSSDEAAESSASQTAAAPVVSSVTASSYLATDSVNIATYGPSNLIDGDLSLCWSEGADGSGVGESVVFTFEGKASVKGFRIANGYQKSDFFYSANERAKSIEVFIDGTSIGTFDIADSGRVWQTVNFSKAYEGSSVQLVLRDVYAGSRYEDCCISEIEFF